MTYGEKITQLRKNFNMTQADLGEKLNVSPQAISKWERNQAEPDINTLKKMSILFNVSIDELLNEEASPEDKKTDIIGFCTQCGSTVTQDNLGENSPKILCKNCLEQNKKQREENVVRARKQAEIKQQSDSSAIRKKRNKSLIWGAIAGILVLVFGLVVGITGTTSDNERLIWIISSIVFGYSTFNMVSLLILDNTFVSDVILWFLSRTIRFPGVIFSFDIDGLIFLIVVKLLFAILGFLFGLLFAIIGLLIGNVLSIFAWPFSVAKVNKQIKGDVPIDSIDLI
ncbi:MAG: helix-turn-helix domain-containing protein [Clostridia bacterium]|nr:helix-turn-helix domain-containing protein [Clostridia bacterium]MDY4082998.1 helix-turn-helix domain-containing protein [Eubacteriales bacterium]